MGSDQIVAHLIGDYILQSHWMAQEKGKRSWPAAAHAVAYTLPFLWITTGAAALALICGSHFVVDRFRLARFVVFVKNHLGWFPHSWEECKATGYPADVPPWLSVWLLIIADNTIHILFNAAAISYAGSI